MIIKNRFMRLSALLVGVLIAGGCSKRNPEKCSESNHCPDPSLPFCDVDGTLGGEPRECVAVACSAEDFEACRGEEEIRCNASGDNFDVVKCELGCEASVGGCRLCEPDQTRCTNGKVGVCDSSGNIVSMETCALGCFDDQPRCRDIDPSNGLAAVMDQVATPTDLDLIDAIVLTETGVAKKLDGTPITVTSFLVGGSPGIRVIVAKNVRIANLFAYRDQIDASNGGIYASGPPLAIVATGTILVDGRITASGGAGGSELAGCSGGVGNGDVDPSGHSFTPGAGGGAHATAGGKGGEVMDRAFGGAGGMPAGTETLVPLRGGCRGGGFSGQGDGGGAVQLSSRVAITVNGVIDVRGSTPLQTEGGGAGGGILIEAPKVTLTATARLIAIGGGGGSGPSENYLVADELDDGMPAQGVACNPATVYCTRGGNGASAGVPATNGAGCFENTSLPSVGGGGGGGGLGRIRINTPDRTYSKSSSTIEAGALTLGVLSTR